MIASDELVIALERAPLGVLILRRGRIVWLNDWLAVMAGQTKADLLEHRWMETALARGQNELVPISAEGGTRYLKRHRLQLSDESEVVYFQDVTEQIELNQAVSTLSDRLQRLETIDPVTGLKNRRAILKELDRQISRSRRYDNPLAIIRLTLEANGGPQRQQELMHALSQTLKDKLRWADEVGILDPSTFLVVLPETSLEDAKELAVKLLNDRAAFHLKEGEGRMRYGVAAWFKGDDLRKLLRRVEQDQEINLSALLS
ncbi:MAG: GGDEF domain-containing protein [Methylohalobius sp.]|nr:GGDEF domain-containing protein [Methylohalobius sp.]